ncbi:MAG: HAMP domain-containing sensor histidine kinase [Chitinivibrionales bacterium]|nr:HAMP domain-containing sensor histidine kinase [Chitinivibrionales bacterium]
MFSIRSKIILFNTILFGAILIVFAAVLYNSVRHNGLARLDAQLEKYASGFARSLESEFAEGGFADTAEINELRAEGPKGIRYRLLDEKGRSILGTLPDASPKNHHPGFSFLVIDGKQYRRMALGLEPRADKDFFLIAAAPLEDVNASLRNLIVVFAFLIPACLALAGLTSWLIIRFAFRPLSRIIRSAAEISASNLDSQLALPKTRDEIRNLGLVFNAMLGRLNAAFKSQKQFAADASHEIRTPLAIIRSELEYAQRFMSERAAKESVEISLTEIDRLAGLAEGLLMLARLDAGQITLNKRPVNLKELLTESLRRVQTLADKKKITLTYAASPEIVVRADAEKISRILLNILDNAIKFSPENGSVSITLKTDSKTATILIADNGPGIDAGDLENIFKRFYRSEIVRADTEGSGLGLAIAQELIRLHNGTISVSSNKAQGTQVSIELPL